MNRIRLQARAALLALLVCVLGAPAGGDLTARGELSREELTIADRLLLTLVVEASPGTSVEPWGDALRGNFEAAGWTVVSIESDPPSFTERGHIRHTTRVLLEAFLPGEYGIPELERTGAAPDGTRLIQRIPPRSITVRSLLPADETVALPIAEKPWEAGLAGEGDAPLGVLRGPPDAPARGAGRRPVLIGALAVSALAAAWVVLRRRTPSGAAPAGWTALDRLERAPDPARLERAMRQDLASTLGPAALAMTGPEFARALAGAGLDADDARRVRVIFDRFERARYTAPSDPSPESRDTAALLAECVEIASRLRNLPRSPGGLAA
jgi:hypothetical protein